MEKVVFMGHEYDPHMEVLLFSTSQRGFHSESLAYYLKDLREHWLVFGTPDDWAFVSITNGIEDYDRQYEFWANVFFQKGMYDVPYKYSCDCYEADNTVQIIEDGVYCPHCHKQIYTLVPFLGTHNINSKRVKLNSDNG